MNSPEAEPLSPRKRTGRIEAAMLKLFTRSGWVLEIEEIGDDFRILTIGGEQLRNVDWTPGDKVQIQLGGWVQRTYTPIDWDSASGRMRILVYTRAGGPGTAWARCVRKDDVCLIFGPRKSIDLTRAPASAIVFGDETSFGLATALLRTVRPPHATLLFEVSLLIRVEPVLARLGLENAHLVEQAADDSHMSTLEEQMLAALEAQPSARIVLSGKASSIQRMRKLLKRSGIEAKRFQVKAYWALGKSGLD